MFVAAILLALTVGLARPASARFFWDGTATDVADAQSQGLLHSSGGVLGEGGESNDPFFFNSVLGGTLGADPGFVLYDDNVNVNDNAGNIGLPDATAATELVNADGWLVEVRNKVFQANGEMGSPSSGLIVYVRDDTSQVSLLLRPDGLEVADGLGIFTLQPQDGQQRLYSEGEFHTIGLQKLPAPSSKYVTYVDGVAGPQFDVIQDPAQGCPQNCLGPTALWGDIMIGRNGTIAELDYFHVNPDATEESTWALESLGDWSSADSWGGIAFPNNANDTAILGSAISKSSTVVVDDTITVNRIEFDNANTYAVAGTGSMNLVTGSDADPKIDVVSGNHQFQVNVDIHNDLVVDVANGSVLSFNNELNLNGQTLTKIGGGTMAVNNALFSGAGTIVCAEGVCGGSGTVGGNLSVDGGTISPGNSSGTLTDTGSSAAVPEPASLLLVLLAGLFGMVHTRSR